jgi:hypothetical protein
MFFESIAKEIDLVFVSTMCRIMKIQQRNTLIAEGELQNQRNILQYIVKLLHSLFTTIREIFF